MTATLVTAICAVLAAVATLITSVINRSKLNQQATQLGEIHLLVNSRLAQVVDRVAELTETLNVAGVAVPPLPTPPTPEGSS